MFTQVVVVLSQKTWNLFEQGIFALNVWSKASMSWAAGVEEFRQLGFSRSSEKVEMLSALDGSFGISRICSGEKTLYGQVAFLLRLDLVSGGACTCGEVG